MVEQPDFIRRQYAFAAHIRDPENNPRPDEIEERRMKIYRELCYNNVEDFMGNTYPVLREITPDDRWHAMMRDYFSNHLAHTPLFPEMPREFLKYLERERVPHPEDPPFMLELAHYEWVELALSISDEKIDESRLDTQGNLLAGIPVISPLVWTLSYQFPVHKISPEYQPEVPANSMTYLVAYRDAEDAVRFIEMNPVTARLLQLIRDNNDKTGSELLEQIVTEINHPQPDIVINGGVQILNDLKNRGVVPGILS